jgi:hypothetical protein
MSNVHAYSLIAVSFSAAKISRFWSLGPEQLEINRNCHLAAVEARSVGFVH